MAAEIDGTSKGLLGAFAVFALGSGIASLIYGVLLLLRYIAIDYNYGVFNLFSTSILLIVVGGLLIITVLLGIIGALKDVSNLRLVTLVLLFILFVILAAVGIWGMLVFKTDRLQASINKDIPGFMSGNAYTSYGGRANDVLIPDSCCVEKNCGTQLYPTQKYFEKGCSSVYYDIKSKAIFCLAILALAAAGAVLIALILYGVVSQRARAGYASVSRG